MKVLEFCDAILTNGDVDIEIYDIDIEDTVWTGKYDGFQPRDVIPKKYWSKTVDSFNFGKNYICINL